MFLFGFSLFSSVLAWILLLLDGFSLFLSVLARFSVILDGYYLSMLIGNYVDRYYLSVCLLDSCDISRKRD